LKAQNHLTCALASVAKLATDKKTTAAAAASDGRIQIQRFIGLPDQLSNDG
jgi:hypothetical protein